MLTSYNMAFLWDKGEKQESWRILIRVFLDKVFLLHVPIYERCKLLYRTFPGCPKGGLNGELITVIINRLIPSILTSASLLMLSTCQKLRLLISHRINGETGRVCKHHAKASA